MTRVELVGELRKLSPRERLEFVEAAIQLLREDLGANGVVADPCAPSSKLAEAARLLVKDYEEDPDLTSFLSLDGEPLHEPR